ncbi:MAG: YtxH domain-containing protein [Ferruginibacter sp.]
MSNTKVVLGIVAGAAAGALLGILFAPDKGSKTRKKIAGKAGDVSDSLKNSFNEFVDELKALGRAEADEMTEKAKAKMNAVKADVKASLS